LYRHRQHYPPGSENIQDILSMVVNSESPDVRGQGGKAWQADLLQFVSLLCIVPEL